MLLAPEVARAACGGARLLGAGAERGCRLLPSVVCNPGPGWGLNVSVDCRGLDVTCGGLRRRTSASFECVVRRAGTAVNLSSPGFGGLETQLRVHASQRSLGRVSTACRSASPLSHALVLPGRPETGEWSVVVGGREAVLSSTTIRNPLPGSHSVLVSRDGDVEEGTALGERESPA